MRRATCSGKPRQPPRKRTGGNSDGSWPESHAGRVQPNGSSGGHDFGGERALSNCFQGPWYGSTDEMLPQFLSRKVACIGWPKTEASALHQMLAQIGGGDIVFMKAHPPSHGLYIKAVGIVDSPEIYSFPDLGVQWVWTFRESDGPVHLGRQNDRYDNFRGGTLYQELGPAVQAAVIDL